MIIMQKSSLFISSNPLKTCNSEGQTRGQISSTKSKCLKTRLDRNFLFLIVDDFIKISNDSLFLVGVPA